MTAKRDGVGGASVEGSVRFEKYIKYLSGRRIHCCRAVNTCRPCDGGGKPCVRRRPTGYLIAELICYECKPNIQFLSAKRTRRSALFLTVGVSLQNPPLEAYSILLCVCVCVFNSPKSGLYIITTAYIAGSIIYIYIYTLSYRFAGIAAT